MNIMLDIVYEILSLSLVYGLHTIMIDNGVPESNTESELRHESKLYHGKIESKIDENEQENEEIKTLLEDKYKFRNDKVSRRFKIAHDDRIYPVFPERHDDKHIAWAFRSYAVRRIVGGMETGISMYPYNVAISRSDKHWCGGSIIDEQWVLTAGHCLESAIDGSKKKLQQFIIRAGSSFHHKGGYQARINKVFFPKNYVPGNADYDYSLLRLDRPMPIGRSIAVLNLPAKNYVVKDQDILVVTGWGSTDESGFGHIPDRLRFVPVPVMEVKECQKSYKFYITKRMLCAGYATGGKDACNHDSGGPAVRDGVLIGIVSFGGKQCGDPRSPGVYSRVAEITDWIEDTITKNEAHTVKELVANIQKAKKREQEFQKFKAQVENKKNKMKSWLQDTLKSPTFIELAKKKLGQVGFETRRSYKNKRTNFSEIDDKTLDAINLYHLFNDIIIEDQPESINESDKLLNAVALNYIIYNKYSEEIVFAHNTNNSLSIESFITYISKE